MSFQDIQGGAKRPTPRTQSPSQAVAAGIFQINTAVATFRRLVDAIGTVKDTPEHRQKLSVSLNSLNSKKRTVLFVYGVFLSSRFFLTSYAWIWVLFGRHNARQKILQLVKDTSAKLKSLSESDHDADVNV